MFTLQQLIESIKFVYLNQDSFEMHKHVVDFHAKDGSFVGDYFNLFIQEKSPGIAPKMYHIGGPFDIISKRAPQRVLGFQNGELFIDQDITHEIDMRTAAMNFVVLSALGHTILGDKNILIAGSGHSATEALKQLHEYDNAVSSIDYVTTKGSNKDFEDIGTSIGITCHAVQLTSLEKYDIIILHTSSRTNVITAALFATVKPTAILHTFIGTHSLGEIAGEVYTDGIQLIVDRPKTLTDSKEIAHQLEINAIKREDVILLDELLSGTKKIAGDKPIIYRTTGAPMQSFAIVRLLETK